MPRKIILFVFSILFIAASHAQYFDWVKSMGGNSGMNSFSVATDDSGNVYSTGYFRDTVDFNPESVGFPLITPSYLPDIFITKTNATGNFSWSKKIGGLGFDQGSAITIDHNGNIYIAGHFTDTVDFDPGTGSYILGSTSTNLQAFILKLDPDGNFLWAHHFTGETGDSFGDAVTINSDNTLLFTGTFNDSIDFDPGPGTSILYNSWGHSTFILKLDSNGDFIWVKNMDGSGVIFPTDIKTDAEKNIILTGIYDGVIDFDPGPGSLYIPTLEAYPDIFITKLDSSGNFVWAKTIGGTHDDMKHEIGLDAAGNIYMGGHFIDTVDFDPGPGTNYLVTAFGAQDMFLLKLNQSGNFQWVKQMVGNEYSKLLSTVVDDSGFVYTAGSLWGQTDFDPGPGIYYLNAPNPDKVFACKMDSSGNFIWAIAIGEPGLNQGNDIAIGKNNEVLITGNYAYTIDADPGLGVHSLAPIGIANSFILQLIQDSCSNLALLVDSAHDISCVYPGFISATGLHGKLPYHYSWNASLSDTLETFQPDTDGIYTIQITDGRQCQRITSVLLTGPTYNNSFDLGTNLVTSFFRPGINTDVWIENYNNGCAKISGTIQLTKDHLLSVNSISPPPDLITGDTMIWNYDSLNYDSIFQNIHINFATSASAVIGDSIQFNLFILPFANDVDSSNNVRKYIFPVINGYDPNDKKVYPIGICEEAYIKNTDKLTYTIRFQNTGNAEAIDIYVLDTIDPLLDIHSIRILGRSHAMITEVLTGNVLKFRFDHIFLPDSGSNEAASNGYIIFEMAADSGIGNNVMVKNISYIYFDYNPAVQTNGVQSHLVNIIPTCSNIPPNAMGLVVYPNPVNNVVFINFPDNYAGYDLQISNLQGQTLISQSQIYPTLYSLDLTVLNTGLYFLTLQSLEKRFVFKLIKN